MKIHKVFRRAIIIGFGLALIVLVAIDVTAYLSSVEYSRSVDVVKRSYQVLNDLKGITADLVSAESEVRGFTITDDERYLSLYEASVMDVNFGLGNLKRSIIDRESLEYLNKFEETSLARLERLDITLVAMKAGGIDAVRQVAGPGKELMDEFRRSAALIESRQLDLLDERDRAAVALSRYSLAVVLMGSVFAVMLLIFSMILLGQQLMKRERLELEVLEISEREQRRIGQDLHDGVCQQLTGISLLSRSLNQKLSESLAAEAAQITEFINECLEMTRRVTRGLHPVPDEPSGLMQALKELAERISTMGKLGCRFVCPNPVVIPERMVATNLYRIAQEACQNALRHAAPKNIVIELENLDEVISLKVIDDGAGLPAVRKSEGIGLDIMEYRARSIGASFQIRSSPIRGTVVACKLPLKSIP